MHRRLILIAIAVGLFAGTIAYAVVDRERVERQIVNRRADYRACSDLHRRAKPARRRELCGWGHLAAIRGADLYGLPFLAIALGLIVVLSDAAARTDADLPASAGTPDPGPPEPLGGV